MGVSADAVTWGYRFFLGREPESPEVVAAHLGAKDEIQLAQVLMSSPEFTARRRQFFLRLVEMSELVPLEVESEATPVEIAACLEKIKAAWSHLGNVSPHFSVLTDKKFLPNNLPKAIDDFWESGRLEAEQVLRTLERHGFTFSGKTCVEYGCGVGRTTTALSPRFARVDAYDISPAHLDLARQRAHELGVNNVRFHECSANMLGKLAACDAFYSRIVFQHNPPPVIAELIRAALRALRPPGIAIFQVPSYMSGYRFKLGEWLETDHPLDMQMHCLPQHKIFEIIAELRCAVLEVREDGATGARDRTISNTFVVRKLARSEEFTKPHLLEANAGAHKRLASNPRAAPAFSARDLQVPKLVFLHHPKSGGTTLHHILLRAFDRDEVCPERFNRLRRYPAGDLARYRFFSGHFDLPSVLLIPGRKKIVTMIREPVSRLISLYYFQRAHTQATIEKNKLDLARLANAYRMKDFFLAPEVRRHPRINNALTRVLVDTVDGDRWEQDARLGTDDINEYAQLALHELASLDAFGLMERYPESVQLICESLGLPVPSEIEPRQVLDVIMRVEPGLRKIDKEPVTDEIRGLIAGLVNTDQKIYAQAQLLFEQRLAALRRRNSAMHAETTLPEGAACSARRPEAAEGDPRGRVHRS